MRTIVEIEWDHPEEQAWLCSDNIATALRAYCPNTKFTVFTVTDASPKEMSASEAIFGFAGWLTTRKVEVCAGASRDASVWAELCQQFCDTNKLQAPRENWAKYLTHPVAPAIDLGGVASSNGAS